MICGGRLGSSTAGALACGAVGASAGFAVWTAADCWAGRIVLGNGTAGVRLATGGIEAGGRGRLPTAATGGGPAISRGQGLAQIVAHPVGRHEADNPAVAGID